MFSLHLSISKVTLLKQLTFLKLNYEKKKIPNDFFAYHHLKTTALCTPDLATKNSTFCPQNIKILCVTVRKKVIFFLYSNN